MMRNYILLAVLFLCFSGCVNSPYYQKSFAIPGNKWEHNLKPNFSIDIEDTTIHYNIHFIIRHTNNYAYSNIWLNVWVKAPGQATFTKTRIEVPLANAQGRWLGIAMGELYEQRRMMVLDHNAIPITDDLISVSEESIPNLFQKKGAYELRIEQNMREEFLSDILHIGMRIEKSSPRKQNAIKPSAT